MKKRRIPGLALAVVKSGAVAKLKGYGLANLEHDVPVTPDSVFELASLTKSFTATAIMLLMEERKIGLDDPIERYLPRSPPKWKGITVRHLLTHTSGLPDMDEGFASLSNTLDDTLDEMFESATLDDMSFPPGEDWQYSDVGYFLLGMIVEKVSGESYAAFLEKRFFRPLDMTATGMLDQWAIVKHRAAGYTLRQGKLAHIRRVSQQGMMSHYGLLSSARNLAMWDIALLSGRILRKESLETMWTPVTLNSGRTHAYGFGWEVQRRSGRRVITHGGITGTEHTILPDNGITVIVLTNLGNRGEDPVHSWGLSEFIYGEFLSPGR